MALATIVLLNFTIAIILTGWFRHRFQNQLLDIPNDRSSHTQPTPRGGGLAFILAFAITTPVTLIPSLHLTSTLHLPDPIFLWLTLTPLVIVGFIDDRGNVPAWVRYLVQLTVAGIAIACFGYFTIPGGEVLGIGGQIIAVTLTIIGITALINFYNFMDGLDGLVASVSTLQLTFLAFYLQQPIFLLLSGAILGFLYWNWSPAKIFMGDAGSTVLGASIAIALLNTDNIVQAGTAIAVTLPLLGDASYTICCRLIRGENIFKAHRTHLYQRLQQSGWSHSQVALTYLLVTGIVIFAITTMGSTGSWLSLVGIIAAIGIGEIYLNWGREEFRIEN